MKRDEFLEELRALLPDDCSRFRASLTFRCVPNAQLYPGLKANGLFVETITVSHPEELGGVARVHTIEVIG